MHYAFMCMNVVMLQLHYPLACTYRSQYLSECGYATFAQCFSMHVELKTSVIVFTTVSLCFSMRVGVKTSVNVVTAVALYALACIDVVMLQLHYPLACM